MGYSFDDIFNFVAGTPSRDNYTMEELEAAKKRQQAIDADPNAPFEQKSKDDETFKKLPVSQNMGISVPLLGSNLSLKENFSNNEDSSSAIFTNLPGFNIFGIIIAPVLHAYFDLFSGFIQTTVFISLTVIFIGQELPEESDVQISEAKEIINTAADQIKQVKSEMTRLNNMYRKERISEAEYDNEYEVLETRLKELEAQLEPAKERDLTIYQELLKSDWKDLYNALTKENKRAFWRKYVKTIEIDESGLFIKPIFF